jgi:uncharacterized protein (DUF1778 family)
MVRPAKPAGEAKTLVIPVRFTDGQREQIKAAATHENLDVSAWLRKVALDAAATVNERAAKRAK